MTKANKSVEWRRLPERVRWDVFYHYCGLEIDTFEDCVIAGIQIVDKDYNDDDWSRYFTFATEDQLDLFLSMAGFENHPSGELWEVEDHQETNIRASAAGQESEMLERGFTIRIPRLDLYIVARNLRRLNSIVIDDYERKWNEAVEGYYNYHPHLR